MIKEACDKLSILLRGEIPGEIDTENISDESIRELAELLNQLFHFISEIQEFILPLSQGRLDEIKLPRPKNFLGSPFKELHSHLTHLTWQAKQVARGDYSQRVDFMGDFSKAFNFMIASLERHDEMLQNKIDQLETAISRITKLESILPICSVCKKIRRANTDAKQQNNWIAIESYISNKTESQFSHSICPECMKKYMAEMRK
jgi:methyl-accepting chemotaxis protein